MRDFYCENDSCKGWETNVVTQPTSVKKIVENGAERIAAGLGIGGSLTDKNLAGKIDHTILKPEATSKEISSLCEEAKKYNFASVCVNSSFVPMCADLLKGTDVKVCTVIGFPLGAVTTEVKRFEAEQAIYNGAQEIDMVINVGRLKEGNYDYVFNDVSEVVSVAKKNNAICKVILETALLN